MSAPTGQAQNVYITGFGSSSPYTGQAQNVNVLAQAVVVPPLGSGGDDGANITGILAGLASLGQGIAIQLTAGTYTVNTPIILPSNSVIVGTPSTILHATMGNNGVGGFALAVFYAPTSNMGTTNKLTADAKIGTDSISVTSPVAAGATIMIESGASGNLQQQATVRSVTNGGLTLRLDEEIMSQYFTTAANAFVVTITTVQDAWIFGNGMRVWGTGDRVVELVAARNCYVDGIYVDHSLGPTNTAGFLNIQFSCDIGCRDCGFSRCRADGGTGYLTSPGPVGTCGFALEGSNRCYIRDCEAEEFSQGVGVGFLIMDSRQFLLENCGARACTNGFSFSANDSFGTEGCREGTVLGGCTTGCTIGWVFDKASEIYCYNSSSVGDATTLSQVGAGVVFFHGVDAKARPSGAYNFFTAIAGDLYLSGKVDLSTGSGTTTICDWSGSFSGTLHIDHFKTIGGTYGFYCETGVARTAIIGPDVDISSTGTPFGGTPSAVTWSFYQGGYVAITGNTTLKYTQASVLRVSAAATINVPAIPHMTYLVDNTASVGAAVVQPSGGTSITVATLKSAILKVNNAGTAMQRVTADT